MRPKLFHAIGLCCAALLLAGCVTNAMRDATADFAEASHSATQSQKQWITAYTDLRSEELRQTWAEERLKMIFEPRCATALAIDDPDLLANFDLDCAIGLSENNGFVPLNDFARFDAILGLNDALGDYADSLIDLTQDWSDDRKLLTEEARNTGVALQGLHGALGKFAEIEGKDLAQQAPDIGGILGTVAGAYLEAKRINTLRRILRSADPMVAQATNFLHQADELALAQDRKSALIDLNAAVDALHNLPANAPSSQYRSAQDAVWSARNELVRLTAIESPFPKIRDAHASLLVASQKGASAAELEAAVVEILELAQSAKTIAENLSQEGD